MVPSGHGHNLVSGVSWYFSPSDIEDWVEGTGWYWARTRDKASHDPIPIPLCYRSHFGWCECGKRTFAYLSGKLRSRILVDQTSLMVNDSESFGVKGALVHTDKKQGCIKRKS
ncbi:hypothetical protein TNCV_1511701 [Trichonephila clavipes]|nr:hypothetical protein TNCV_1511701 [Trichonephila clavipes]